MGPYRNGRLTPRGGALFLLMVLIAVSPGGAGAAEGPLAWADLEGANLRLDPPQTDSRESEAVLAAARRRLVGGVFFHDATDELAVVYQFSRTPTGVISVEDSRIERDRQMAHLERFVVRDVVLGNHGPVSAEAVYLIVQPDRHPEGAIMVGGGLVSVALVFTQRDLQKFAQWPPSIQTAVREQRVASGMTRSQVVMSRGVPGQRKSATNEAGITEKWCYPALHVLFSEGKVIRTEERQGRC